MKAKSQESGSSKWPMVRLGDVCEVIAGQSPDGSNYTKDDSYTEFHQGSKAFGLLKLEPSGVFTKEETKIAEAGSLLMSVRAPVGDLNITDRRVCIGRGLAAFRLRSGIDRDYLFHYLLSARFKLEQSAGAGTCFASISKKQIEALTIPLPPLAEQRKIVAKLEKELARVDAMKAMFERGIEACSKLRKALLAEAFAGEGA